MNEAIMNSELWHYGVKGMKWGVRRSKEELAKARGDTLENKQNSVILKDGVYYSDKGFTCDEKKITGFCLKPGAKHSDDFFNVGYEASDSELLIQHINDGYDIHKAVDREPNTMNYRTFEVEMELGVTEKKKFVTGWSIRAEGEQPRFTTAYRRSSKKKGD